MKILPNIEIVDLGLYLKKERVLIVSDFHLGYERMLEEKGMLIPKFQLKDVLERLGKILERVKVKKIVINGDLKHEHGKILEQEWRDVLKLFDFLLGFGEVVVVKGNHDLLLGPIAGKRGVSMVKEYKIGEVLVAHGDEVVRKDSKVLVIGHEHPAIVLEEKGKKEKYKCWLMGKWKRKKLIVMPSFNLMVEGTDVLKGRLLSPYLEDVSKFEVYAVGEKEVLRFGKVKSLISNKL